jgi:gliding motility-associated-like protein
MNLLLQPKIFIITLLALIPWMVQAQCDVTINASTLTVPCGGGNVTLTANGTGFSTTPINNTFDGLNAGPGWNVSPAGQFDNPCNNGPDGTPHMWMGNTTTAPRTLETASLDLSCGGDICFDLVFAAQGGAAPCEGPDLANEGVFLEYSTNNGGTWTQINYFDPNGGNDPQMTSWNNYCFPVPPGAQTTNTVIHWFQGGASGTRCDHWGIDNVIVSAVGCDPVWYDWDFTVGTTGPNGDNATQTIFVDKDTTVTVTFTDGNGFICSESVTITIDGMGPPLINLTDETCLGDDDGIANVTEGAGGVGPYDFTLTAGPNTPITNNTGDFTGLAPGNYTVEVSDNGSTCVVTENFTIAPGPQCCFLQTTEDVTQAICGTDGNHACNGEIEINDTGGQGNVVYSLDNGNTLQNSSSFLNLCSGTYDVYVEDDNNCVITKIITITDPPLPTAGFDFTEVCEDLAIDFTSTSNVAIPGTITNYNWDVDQDNTTDYTIANPSHAFGSDNSYDVTLEIVTDSGCKDEITQTVEVFSLPEAEFTADPLCFGGTTVFTDQSINGDGSNISAWDWDFDDGNTANIQDPDNEYILSGFYDVTLSITTDNGCTDNVTEQIEIFPLPTADFNVTNDCYYNALSFQNQSSVNVAGFEWDFNDGNSSVDENPSNAFNQAGTYNVELIVTTANGCKDTIVQDAIAYAKPTAGFSVAEVCFNFDSEFTNESVVDDIDGDQITGWNWSFGDGASSNNQGPSHLYGGEDVYNVSLTVTTNFGCEESVTNTATVWPLPQVDFTPTEVCLEYTTEFQDLTAVSNLNTSNSVVAWNWSFGDGGASTGQNPDYAYSNDGLFNATLEAVSNHGCINDSTKVITVHPKPIVDFVGENLSGCSPVCFDISSTTTVNTPSNLVDYTWRFSDGTTYSSQDSILSDCFYNYTGNTQIYSVNLIATTNEGCKDSTFKANYIEVFHNPIASFNYEPEVVDVLDPTVEIINNSQFADTYNWTVSSLGLFNGYSPVFEFAPLPDTQNIELIAWTNEGCSDTAYAVVDILDRLVFYVPNTFTPDSDNFNEVFQPIFTSGFDPFNFNMKIFNRWGEIVFETNNAKIGWNGTYGNDNKSIVRDGTYIWKIEFKETGKDKRVIKTGHVNVLK